MNKYAQDFLNQQLLIQKKFLPKLYYVVEESLIYYSFGQYLKAVVRIYSDSTNQIDLLSLKKKFGEFQGKINGYKLQDKLLKGVLAKIIKHVENYFMDEEERVHYHFMNIALIFEFMGDYETLKNLIEIRQFDQIKHKVALQKLLSSTIRKNSKHKIKIQAKSRMWEIVNITMKVLHSQKAFIKSF